MQHHPEECGVERRVGEGGLMAVLLLESDVCGFGISLREIEHAGRKIRRRQPIRPLGQETRVETRATSKFHYITQVPFAPEPIPRHCAGLRTNLEIHHRIVFLRNLRPEVTVCAGIYHE